MLAIQKKLIKYNHSSGNELKYIVIHDTGNTGKGANALAHFNYFNGGDRQASAHYFVDDSNIIQTVEDNDAAWHCGDGRGVNGITNHNSIGIETCINSDGNYGEALTNTLELVKYLMNKYNIPAERVVRHYDASRKNCPGRMNIDKRWSGWTDFKNRLIEQPTPAPSGSIVLGSKVNVVGIKYATGQNIPAWVKKNAYTVIQINSDRALLSDIVSWVYIKDLVTEGTPSTPQASVKMGTITASVLNVRKGAGTNYPVVGQLKKGQKVKLDVKNGNWWSIYFGDHGGFVSADYIEY